MIGEAVEDPVAVVVAEALVVAVEAEVALSLAEAPVAPAARTRAAAV